MDQSYPIDEVMPRLIQSFGESRNVVLSAPPGAGKTTRVPVALMQAGWLAGRKILMLEPRRLAASRAAQYMTSQRTEKVGQTIGYRIRGESRIGPSTRIEVVTEGVLTRMLLEQPDLPDVGLVIFDEFHERSIHADLGLALTLDVQTHLREDLRVLVMSATLDGVAVTRLLGDAPIVESAGAPHPVDTRYRSFAYSGPVEPAVAETVLRSLETEGGDVLVFLPGQREIRRVEQLLQDATPPSRVAVHALFGEAAPEHQQAALAPAPPGMRKVILSTSIAETSLTIDGVRIVVDSGFARGPRFDPRRGMSGLVTMPVSRATADQRRGRAGRQGPGLCYRMWTEDQHASLAQYPLPEILVADLAPLALSLAQWGVPDGQGLRFLDPLPNAHLTQAQGLLKGLGALDPGGKLTPHGREMAALPVHPRLAHMMIRGKELHLGAMACDCAALLAERDLLRGTGARDVDFTSRMHALRTGGGSDGHVRDRVLHEAQRLRNLLGIMNSDVAVDKLGVLLALAYPERVAKRRTDRIGKYQMVNGTGAAIPEWSPLVREEFLAIAEVDGVGTDVQVFLASSVQKPDLLTAFRDQIETAEEIFWSSADEAVVSRRIERLGALPLVERLFRPDGDAEVHVLLEGIRQMGLGCLPWDRKSETLRSRSEWLRIHNLAPDDWPDLSDKQLNDRLPEWLGPFLQGMNRRAHLAGLKMTDILRARFTLNQQRHLDRLAPPAIVVPTGSHIALDYATYDHPVLAVRLQEMFGQTDTPTVADGRTQVSLHLLSPAGRQLAVTQDLRSFWLNTYPEVRKQMRGRYPKHSWPEDPMTAKPTRRVKKPSRGK